MNELQLKALTLATANELRMCNYIIIWNISYTFDQIFPNGIIGAVEIEENECSPCSN